MPDKKIMQLGVSVLIMAIQIDNTLKISIR